MVALPKSQEAKLEVAELKMCRYSLVVTRVELEMSTAEVWRQTSRGKVEMVCAEEGE